MSRSDPPPAADSLAIDPLPGLDVPADAAGSPGLLESMTGHRNMLQLIQLRWFAVLGQVLTLLVVSLGLGIHLPLPPMLEVLICLVAFNIASTLRWRERAQASPRELFVALLVDVAALTTQLYFTGGAANPFVSLYLLQLILGTLLLEPRLALSLAAVMLACLCGLTLFARPLAWPEDPHHGLGSVYIQGTLLSFAINAGLLVMFMSRIQDNLRQRDARLALLRQRAGEQRNIVRMGLLASGAAHELGTPLATMSVIVGDWRRMPLVAGDVALCEDIGEIEAQLLRCKAIVSGILLSAGETRGESAQATTLAAFLATVVEQWRARRPEAGLEWQPPTQGGLPMVGDVALRQMIGNLLDNAFEAAPAGIRLDAWHDQEWLSIRVADRGTGFPSAVLAGLGRPYLSTKGRPGGGLGLFLVVNVAHTLGGVVTARNRPEGGAEVVVRLPLASLSLDGPVDGDD